MGSSPWIGTRYVLVPRLRLRTRATVGVDWADRSIGHRQLRGRRFTRPTVRLECDLFDRAGERERPLRFVVRADRGDRVAADLERLDAVDHHPHTDASLTR